MGDGEKACPCCQFYGVSCRQVRATDDEATTRKNQRLFSGTKRKRSHQEQLVENSLFLDNSSVDELQTIQKRKDHECSRDTQVKNQELYDYVDGLTITMNVIQPRGRKESKEQTTEMMQDVMLSSHGGSHGGQPSSDIHHHRMCYQCEQKGHYAKSCPQKRLSPAPRQAGQQGRPAQPRARSSAANGTLRHHGSAVPPCHDPGELPQTRRLGARSLLGPYFSDPDPCDSLLRVRKVNLAAEPQRQRPHGCPA